MAYDDAIIFINNLETTPKRSRLLNSLSYLQLIKMHFSIPLHQLPKRIIYSFVPPIFGKNRHTIHVDLLGPLLAILTLIILLHYGHANKLPSAVSTIPPFDILLAYVFLMPIFSYILIRLGQSSISFIEIASILGYALFGHIFTLLISLLLYNEESNFFFFICMLIFGGLSTLKIVLILVALIPKPVLRLIICSFVSTLHLMFLMTLHFLYMHRTFRYGGNRYKY